VLDDWAICHKDNVTKLFTVLAHLWYVEMHVSLMIVSWVNYISWLLQLIDPEWCSIFCVVRCLSWCYWRQPFNARHCYFDHLLMSLSQRRRKKITDIQFWCVLCYFVFIVSDCVHDGATARDHVSSSWDTARSGVYRGLQQDDRHCPRCAEKSHQPGES